MSKESQDWLKRQIDLYEMDIPGMVKSPKPGTLEHYKWITETYDDDEPERNNFVSDLDHSDRENFLGSSRNQKPEKDD